MCRNWLYRIKVKRQIKNTEVDAKGVCLSIYCAKVFMNLLKDDEIIYAYETDLKNMHHQLNPNNPYYDYDERQAIAFQYLSVTLNCKNGEYVKQRIEEEIGSYV